MFRLFQVAYELALNNLRAKRERTILTLSSVTLAVIITILLVSLSDRAITSMKHSFFARDVDIYCFPPQVPIELGPITISSASEYIPMDMIDQLERDEYLLPFEPHVTGVQKMIVTYRGYNLPLVVLQLEKLRYFYPKALKYETILKPGTLSDSEVSLGVAVIGNKVAKMFSLTEGGDILLLNQRFIIAKILPPLGSYEDYTIFLDLDSTKIFQVKGLHQLWISFGVPVKTRMKDIMDYLRKNYPAYKFYSSQQLMNAQLGSAKALRLLQFAIALIGILIAFTATTNTMLISTYERIREFGILLALGAPRFMVFMSIMMEGILVSFLGGTLGVILGLVSMYAFEYSLRSLFRFAFPLTGISTTTFIDIIFIIFGLGAFSSLVPAYIASSLHVARALRWE